MDPSLPVDTAWDLGIDDYTAIWFFQQAGREIRVLDYFETSGEGLPSIVRQAIAGRDMLWGTHHLPHDVMVRELATGRSRYETLRSLGLARIGMLLLGDGTFALNGEQLLTPASLRMMETPVWQYDGHNGMTYEQDGNPSGSERGMFCHWGLGMQILATKVDGCRDDPFGDGITRVGHSGSAYGLQSGLWLDRASGTGVAWFLTGMPDSREGGRSAFSAAEEQLAH